MSNHKIVVTATTKGNSAQLGMIPSRPKRVALIEGIVKVREINPEATIAVISLHAFILHQNHLRIKIRPVPAPNTNKRLNNCIAFCRSKANRVLRTISKTVEILPTATSCF